MQAIIENNIEQIKTVCKKHLVKQLHVFGSAVRNDFNEGSDVDFLVEYQPLEDVYQRVDNINALQAALETLLRREVDLIQYSLLENKYLKHFINQEKVLLYAEA